MSEHPPYLDKLNPVQRQAAMCIHGPVMIIAGAGSGKTRVLTYRIAHMIKKGIDAFNILSLTFTNKAAKEMKNRIETVVGSEARNVWMGTFHSVFAKILRIEADKIGYPKDFTIYDTDDSKSLLKSILKELNLDDKVYKPGLVYNRISSCKNSLITASDYINIPTLVEDDSSAGRPLMGKIFAMYQQRCFKAGAMDFDDLLLNTYLLLTKHTDVLNKYQHKFKYVMVDEYQDTNLSQYMIVKKLAAVNQNICVVGDDSQSIYSFRGANIENILNFQKDYPDLHTFKLEHNYRSTSNIVNASSSIIDKNREKLDKRIYTDNEEGEKIKVMRAISDNEEGKMVAQSIFEEKNQKQLANTDFAILYRTNAQSRSFEESLRKLNIPYRIYGGMSFYQRKEIKDMVAYLRVVVNPNDEEAIKRIINYPSRKIGATTIDKLVLLASENDISIWEVIKNCHTYPLLGSSIASILNFYIMIASFQTMLETKNAYEVAEYIAKQSTLLKTLYDDKTVEGVSRHENLMALLNAIKEFTEDDMSEEEKNLATFIQSIALLTDADKDAENKDTVTLMTIHSSKGLEFKHVYVVGLEENLFPGQMSLNSRQDLEEERRLFYVAVTRAEEKLNLSFATSRFKYGNLINCEPSRFLDEIDKKYLDILLPPNLNQGSHSDRQFLKKEDTGFGKGYGMNVGGKMMTKPIVNIQISANFAVSDTLNLAEGNEVEHQRFGKGTVINMLDIGENRKAVIAFNQVGEKTLVLKFAKLMILN
ncbi:MAG: exodeoxyribonuclease V subunit gamma [Bacteroidetes bacterium]|nr:exodeoxyribonuclease V subunit gamma [Bacteroidota bacterium]